MTYSNWSTKILASYVGQFRLNLLLRSRPVFIVYMILKLKAYTRLLYEKYIFDLLFHKHCLDWYRSVFKFNHDFYSFMDCT